MTDKHPNIETPHLRVRHQKRGTTYVRLGVAELQSAAAIREGERLTLYRAEADGRLWARPCDEFDDGRFELAEIPAPAEVSAASLRPVIHSIMAPVTAAGGSMNDVMDLLEKVVTGVLLAASQSSEIDDRVLEILAGNVRGHLTRARIAGIKVEGSA